MMRSRAKRDAHFRPGFKIDPRSKTKVKVKVPGWDARRMAKGEGPLGIAEMMYRTGLKTPKVLAKECRAGRLPMWRFDRMSGRVLWHRLEFEAFMFWRRARKARARP
jgi:hypothetical protein